MALPIALQLYTIREALDADYSGVIAQVAQMGYLGVETAGQFGASVQDAVKQFHDLGLTVVGAHSPLPLGDKKNEVLDTMAALGAKRLICPWLPPERFQTEDSIKAVCDELNQADEVARQNGLTLLYHNHQFEYEPMADGQRPYRYMLKYLAPSVQFEIDTYWVKVGGCDPASVIRELGSRAPLLHIKDGPGDKDQPMLAVGEGFMDWPSVIEAANHSAEWLVVELDRCATDMLEAVRKSYAYLVGKGYARGQ